MITYVIHSNKQFEQAYQKFKEAKGGSLWLRALSLLLLCQTSMLCSPIMHLL